MVVVDNETVDNVYYYVVLSVWNGRFSCFSNRNLNFNGMANFDPCLSRRNWYSVRAKFQPMSAKVIDMSLLSHILI